MSGAEGQCFEVRSEGWKCEFPENADKQTFCMLADTEKNRKTNHFEYRSPGQRRRSKNVFSSYLGPVRTPAQKTHSHLYLRSSPFSILPLCLWVHLCSCADKQIKILMQLLKGLPITVFPAAQSSPRDLPSTIRLMWGEECCCCSLVTQLCLTLCDPMDCTPPGSSVHGIVQASILE